MGNTVNELFCASDADVTLKSSDGVLFKVHRRNLAAYSEAFPGEEIPSAGEIVHLSENAATLELLLQFMARQRHPVVRGLPFDMVAPLAEAAEKYQVYSAVSVCNLYMQDNLRAYPLGVLNYAMRHGYPTLCDEAAPLTVDEPLDIALEILGPVHFISWVRYRDLCIDLMRDILSHPPDSQLPENMTECSEWAPFYANMVSKFCHDIATIFDKSCINAWSFSCRYCVYRAAAWQVTVNTGVHALPELSEVMKSA